MNSKTVIVKKIYCFGLVSLDTDFSWCPFTQSSWKVCTLCVQTDFYVTWNVTTENLSRDKQYVSNIWISPSSKKNFFRKRKIDNVDEDGSLFSTISLVYMCMYILIPLFDEITGLNFIRVSHLFYLRYYMSNYSSTPVFIWVYVKILSPL